MKRTILALSLALTVTTARAQIVVQAWVQRFKEPGESHGYASSIAVSAEGNVFVTGGTGHPHRFLPDNYSTTVAYSGAGVPLWTNRFNVPGSTFAQANGIVANTSGNVFVTGYSYGTNSNEDYLTIAYSNTGTPLWTNLYNGPGNSGDRATALAVDGSGNVFVTGRSSGIGSQFDYATIAYSDAGVPLWTNRYDGPAQDYDRAYAIAAGGNGNVFVTGNSFGGGGLYDDCLTIAYSHDGVPLWTNHYKGTSGIGGAAGTAIAVDGEGCVIVSGYTATSDVANYDDGYATIKYSRLGVPLWTNLYGGPGDSGDRATALAMDANGNVFVTGTSFGTNNSDYATVAYSGTGIPLWTNRYNGKANGGDSAAAMAVTGDGHIVVTGTSARINTADADYATIAYSVAGIPLWTNFYVGPGSDLGETDMASGIAVDSAGNIYVTGSSIDTNGYHYATIKYSVRRPIPLASQLLNNQLVLSWANTAFGLQSAPAITGTFTNIPGATSPYTNPISGGQQFFRLISN